MKKLGFGFMRLPLTNPDDKGAIDIELTKKMVDEFLARGFTYFDTAWPYCNFNSENANYLYLATGTADGGGSVMDFLISIAPNVWGRLALLTGIVLAMFFIAYGVNVGIRRLAGLKKAKNNQ